MGTIRGAWSTILIEPLTLSVNLASAETLSRVRALAAVFSARASVRLLNWEPYSAMNVSTSSRAYQTARLSIPAKVRIAWRYWAAHSSTTWSASPGEKPLSWEAIMRLAASRLTSHSQGPGSVSSKSLMSNTSRRSGEAKTPKLDRWASPQHCTRRPETGVVERSWVITLAAPR